VTDCLVCDGFERSRELGVGVGFRFPVGGPVCWFRGTPREREREKEREREDFRSVGPGADRSRESASSIGAGAGFLVGRSKGIGFPVDGGGHDVLIAFFC
jgi:hypothetical protein